MPERMSPERLQEIEDSWSCSHHPGCYCRISVQEIRDGLQELIAEIKSCWSDIEELAGEVEAIKHSEEG